jgi:hypothetical protein
MRNITTHFEKNLRWSQRRLIVEFVLTLICLVAAFVVWRIWHPGLWVYVLLFLAGPFAFIGDLINICYCKRKIETVKEQDKKKD